MARSGGLDDADSDPPYRPSRSVQAGMNFTEARPVPLPQARPELVSQNPSHSNSWRSSGSVDGIVPTDGMRAGTTRTSQRPHLSTTQRQLAESALFSSFDVRAELERLDANSYPRGPAPDVSGADDLSLSPRAFCESRLSQPQLLLSKTAQKPSADWAREEELHGIAASAPWRPAGDSARWRQPHARSGSGSHGAGTGNGPLANHPSAPSVPSHSIHLQPAAALMLGGETRGVCAPAPAPAVQEDTSQRPGTVHVKVATASSPAAVPADVPTRVQDWPQRTSQLDSLHRVRCLPLSIP